MTQRDKANEVPIALKPYSKRDDNSAIEFDVARSGEVLSLSFGLSGGGAFQGQTKIRSRVTGLWEDTCFEFFLANGSELGYAEFNFSPPGDWQVFRFSDYRSARQVDSSWLPHDFSRREETPPAQRFTFSMRSITGIWPEYPLLQAAAVIRQREEIHYYTLSHDVTPDFHLRDHFRDGSDFDL